MLNGAKMPQASELLNALDAVILELPVRQRIFVDNPAELFGWSRNS